MMLAKAPADRYPTAAAFVAALQATVHTAAQSQLREAQVAPLYANLLAAKEAGNWLEVMTLAAQIEIVSPDYKDVSTIQTEARASLQTPAPAPYAGVEMPTAPAAEVGQEGSEQVPVTDSHPSPPPNMGQEQLTSPSGKKVSKEDEKLQQTFIPQTNSDQQVKQNTVDKTNFDPWWIGIVISSSIFYLLLYFTIVATFSSPDPDYGHIFDFWWISLLVGFFVGWLQWIYLGKHVEEKIKWFWLIGIAIMYFLCYFVVLKFSSNSFINIIVTLVIPSIVPIVVGRKLILVSPGISN